MNRAHVRLHVVFAGMGATAAGVPAVLPSAQAALGAEVLAAAPVLFLGLLLGVGISGLVGRVVGAPVIVLVGASLQAGALILAAFAGSAVPFIIAAGLAGLGFGMTESAGAVVVKSIAAASVTGPITGLTATVAATATVIPLVVLVLGGMGSARWVLVLAAAINATGAVAVAGLIRGGATRGMGAGEAPSRRVGVRADGGTGLGAPDGVTGLGAASAARRSLSSAVATHVVILAIATALYVGAESILAGWSSTIPFALLDAEPHWAALGTSAFWALMTVGRLTALTAIRRGASARRVVGASTLIAGLALGVVAVAVGVSAVLALAAMAFAILLLAPSYGILLGLALDRVAAEASQPIASLLVACGAGGGALLPLLVLWLGATPGDATTFLVAAVACILLSALIFATRSPATAAPSRRAMRTKART